MQKIARFIVQKRWLFFILFAALIVYCIFGIRKVKVEYDITTYLPQDTDTAQALKIMDDEFAVYGSSTVMIKDIEFSAAYGLYEKINKIDGISGFSFSADEKYYKDGNALFSMAFAGGSGNERAVAAYDKAIEILDDSGYAYAVPTPLVNNYADTLAKEMIIIIAIAAAVILLVLLFTSKSFAEVIAFPIVFAVAAVLNMGTNYWLGTISFVSNTVCIILQLALAIDYAIILCHRFTEEKDRQPTDPQAALIAALGKAIPEIASSSLTTVSGLVALMFMQLGLGFDLGMVLAKSILCSLIAVFLLMPGILLLLSKLMDKSRHKSFVPKIRFWGRGVIKLRYVLIAAFAALFGVGAWLSQTVTYCYSQNAIDTSRPTATKTAQNEADRVFGYSNMFVLLVPNDGDYEKQRLLLDAVAGDELINSAQGLASIKLGDEHYLTDSFNYSEFHAAFGDMLGVDSVTAMGLFVMYARHNGDSVNIFSMSGYRVVLLDLLEYVIGAETELGLSEDRAAQLTDYKALLEYGKAQLVGTEHVRLVFNIDAPTEGEATFAMIERLSPKVKEICPQAIFAGASMSAYDLNESFSYDNVLITVLTVLFIYLILALTFGSPCLPIILVLVIQGAIFMNFSLPAISGNNLFFFTYLIVSAIQMGATIDYAILMTNRFNGLKTALPKREALIEAISASFPTIMTSGAIMTVAAFLVGFLTSDPLISSMGMMLGSGTLISIASVLTVLPALLYVLDPVLSKTVIKRRLRAKNIKMPNPSRIPFFD